MHQLTCKRFNIGDMVYAAIPTYTSAQDFLYVKFYIESMFVNLTQTFYHGQILELFGSPQRNLRILSKAQFKMIDRKVAKLELKTIRMPAFFENSQMLNAILDVNKDFKFDLPAPFATSSYDELLELSDKISNYFLKCSQNCKLQ